MFFDIKQIEHEKYAEKFKTPITTQVIYDNYYRFVLKEWFIFKQNKYLLNNLWHSFFVCSNGYNRFMPEGTYLILPIKNIQYGSITFNGIKNKRHLTEHKYNLDVDYICLYNKWTKYQNNLNSLMQSPAGRFRSMKAFINGVEEENRLEQICRY